MSIYDPEIEVICDGCGDTEFVKPEFKYNDYSGNSGNYDCSDKAVVGRLPEWVLDDTEVFCGECAKKNND